MTIAATVDGRFEALERYEIPQQSRAGMEHYRYYVRELTSSILCEHLPAKNDAASIERWLERGADQAAVQRHLNPYQLSFELSPLTGSIEAFNRFNKSSLHAAKFEFTSSSTLAPRIYTHLLCEPQIPSHRKDALIAAAIEANQKLKTAHSDIHGEIDPSVFYQLNCPLKTSQPKNTAPQIADYCAGMIVSMRLVEFNSESLSARWVVAPTLQLPNRFTLRLNLDLTAYQPCVRLTLDRKDSPADVGYLRGFSIEAGLTPADFRLASLRADGKPCDTSDDAKLAVRRLSSRLLGTIAPHLELENAGSRGLANRLTNSWVDRRAAAIAFEYMKTLLQSSFPDPFKNSYKPDLSSGCLPPVPAATCDDSSVTKGGSAAATGPVNVGPHAPAAGPESRKQGP